MLVQWIDLDRLMETRAGPLGLASMAVDQAQVIVDAASGGLDLKCVLERSNTLELLLITG